MADLLFFMGSIRRFFKNTFGNELEMNPKRCSFCGVWMKKVEGKKRLFKCPECDYEVVIVNWLVEDDGGGIAPGFK